MSTSCPIHWSTFVSLPRPPRPPPPNRTAAGGAGTTAAKQSGRHTFQLRIAGLNQGYAILAVRLFSLPLLDSSDSFDLLRMLYTIA